MNISSHSFVPVQHTLTNNSRSVVLIYPTQVKGNLYLISHPFVQTTIFCTNDTTEPFTWFPQPSGLQTPFIDTPCLAIGNTRVSTKLVFPNVIIY